MRPNTGRGIDAFLVSSEIRGFVTDSSRGCAKDIIIKSEAVDGQVAATKPLTGKGEIIADGKVGFVASDFIFDDEA